MGELNETGLRHFIGWQDLDVWKLAHELTIEVYAAVAAFPDSERFRLSDQLLRAVASVPTNIAEGKGRGSVRDFCHFLVIARGSLEETRYLLVLARDLAFIGNANYELLEQKSTSVSKMLNSLIKRARQQGLS